MFKGDDLAARKSIGMKHTKNKDNLDGSEGGSRPLSSAVEVAAAETPTEVLVTFAAGGDDIYAINATKKQKYEELFPVKAKKFGYTPKMSSKSVDEALVDCVKKNADRNCKQNICVSVAAGSIMKFGAKGWYRKGSAVRLRKELR
ncbi:PREDICTED: uncharacterized protein LOC104813140 [Tarenaya hassleriana]|uniref:uncharacterized protein LOC104813140 n=1 Tax=Tarenaya hassleriana TaxID=28532 RepID=UPI00053C8A84|nr:PREDICTED: uncharacterized protein LOC104813140 [Tarenaya hassleriana]XP_010538976.1 PREDICTED: uncharacterized protein LOC104813140 [Tarenaya hassleriana]